MYRMGYRCLFSENIPITLLLVLCCCSLQVRSQGNLLVMPRRVVFDGSLKSQELNLANIGKDTARYTISLIDVRMKPDGNFEVISEPDSGQQFAGRYLRFFPRSVLLAPGESQVVKMQVARQADMRPGEYRSHIYFRAVPADIAPEPVAPPLRDSSLSIRIVPVFGISIPVIIRVGETAAQVGFTDISFSLLNDSIPQLNFGFTRSGNRSVYGDLAVNFIPAQGKPFLVGRLKGVAVYTPNKSRYMQLRLEKPAGLDYRTGSLQLVYTSAADQKYEKFAETTVALH